MDHLTDALEVERLREKKLKALCEAFLATAPKGHLAVRRSRSTTYYWAFEDDSNAVRREKQINITDNQELIQQLTEKMIKQHTLRQIENNLPQIEKLSRIYRPVSSDEIIKSCAPKYQDALLLRKKQLLEERLTTPYIKCPYDPNVHVHETDYGEFVRSKSEQLLGNTLFAYGIPFHYEEAFVSSSGVTLFPDFRILLPDDDWILWEHLGLLSKSKYCLNTARKLNAFQQSGLAIGNNLILTMDDSKGDFSSAIINHMITNQLLPRMQGIKIDRNKIIEGIMQPYMK